MKTRKTSEGSKSGAEFVAEILRRPAPTADREAMERARGTFSNALDFCVRLRAWYQTASIRGTTAARRREAQEKAVALADAETVLRSGRDHPERASGFDPVAILTAARPKGAAGGAIDELVAELAAL
jgi:hypothetical protein